MQITQDSWLASVFGHSVFKLNLEAELARDGEKLIPQIVPGIRDHAAQQQVGLYYGKIDTDRVEIVRQLMAAGFYVVDVNVTFSRESDRILSEEPATEVVVSEVRPEDRERVLSIAASCFKYSRFHLDPLVPGHIANQVKYRWILNYLQKNRGERLWAGLIGGQPVGFLAVLATESNGKRIRTIDLIGVDDDYQGRGVGSALGSFFVNQYRVDCDLLQVGTQAANVPSMRLYEKLGFSISATQYVLHMHVGDGAQQV